MNFKSKRKSKKYRLSNYSVSPGHHYLQKQSSKIFYHSPRIDLDTSSNPHLPLTIENQKQLPFNNIENTYEEADKVHLSENDNLIAVNGVTGVWMNKKDSLKWRDPIPLEKYKTNQDTEPIIIQKRRSVSEPSREISIRYLKPTKLPDAGDLIIKEDEPILFPPAPPIVLSQNSTHLGPRIIREKPPPTPQHVPTQIITIPGKILDPPSRQVIVERVYENCAPQEIVIERWLSYPKQTRNIVFQPFENNEKSTHFKTPQNIIIDWDFDDLNKEQVRTNIIEPSIKFSVPTVNSNENENKYLTKHIDSNRFSDLISQYEKPQRDVEEFILKNDSIDLIDKSKDDINKYLYAKL